MELFKKKDIEGQRCAESKNCNWCLNLVQYPEGKAQIGL